MNQRHLLSSPALWISAAAIAVGAVLGCSSSQSSGPTSTAECTAGSTVSCTCSNGQSGTELCGAAPSACKCAGSPAEGSDAGAPPEGDGGHLNDGATPSQLYAACAVPGSFGAGCTQPNANDPTNCTDPEYPYCFGGGQGYWCTKPCTATGNECTTGVEDAGCIPTQCNARGYCK
jgi:hypothetical protein